MADQCNHGRILAAMPKISPEMRKASAVLCEHMDELRKERKTAVERRCYLQSIGKEEEASAVLQRIAAIDAEVGKLHAAAKRQLLLGIGTDLTQGAALLQVATSDHQKIRTSAIEKTERYVEEMRQLMASDKELDCAFEESVGTMYGAAVKITECNEEQASETEAEEAISAPAGSSTGTKNSSLAGSSKDIHCPHCSKKWGGAKGLASHLRGCK